MHIELLNQPGSTVAKFSMLPEEVVAARAGTLLAMSAHLKVSTKDCIKPASEVSRPTGRIIEGDRFICNHFRCSEQTGDLWLGNDLPGDMLSLEFGHQAMIINRYSFLAATGPIELSPHTPAASACWLKITGTGNLVLSAFGSISRLAVEREYQVAMDHIVAFSNSLEVDWPGKRRRWSNRLFRSDNAYCRISGRGTLWYQSHDPEQFGNRLPCGQPSSGSA